MKGYDICERKSAWSSYYCMLDLGASPLNLWIQNPPLGLEPVELRV
jgi:hypothetical protein